MNLNQVLVDLIIKEEGSIFHSFELKSKINCMQ